MKNALLLTMLIALSSTAAAQDFSGIWYTSNGNYVSAHQKGNTVIFASLGVQASTGGLWEAYSGQASGNTLIASTAYGYVNSIMTITLLSATSLKAVQNSCVPMVAGYACAYANGYTITATKIF